MEQYVLVIKYSDKVQYVQYVPSSSNLFSTELCIISKSALAAYIDSEGERERDGWLMCLKNVNNWKIVNNCIGLCCWSILVCKYPLLGLKYNNEME